MTALNSALQKVSREIRKAENSVRLGRSRTPQSEGTKAVLAVVPALQALEAVVSDLEARVAKLEAGSAKE